MSKQTKVISITDEGRIALLEYEARGLRRIIILLSLTVVGMGIAIIFSVLR